MKSLSNREFVKIIAGIISFVSFTEYNVSGKALSIICPYLKLSWISWLVDL